METISLKALAYKVLQRNSQGNFLETAKKEDGNLERNLHEKIISNEKVSPLRGAAYRVYSDLLQAYLWVVDTDQDMHSLMSQGISEAIYSADEIRKLRGISKDSLKEIHKVKEIFPKSKIEKIKVCNG